jgi:hypothetical protein
MRREACALAVLAVLLGAGCGGGGSGATPPADSPSDPPDDGVPAGPRTVSGTWYTSYRQDGAVSDVPDDLTTTVVAAFVPTATGYRIIPGTGDAAGHFRVEDVPPGEFLLQVGDTFYATDASDLDGGVRVFGRAPSGMVADGTVVAIELAGLAPLSEYDEIQIVSPEANNWTFNVAGGSPLAVGATTLSVSRPFGEVFAMPTRIEAALGDHAVVGQLSVAPSGLLTLSRAAVLDGFTATAGTAALSATLAELPVHTAHISIPATFGSALATPPAEEPGRVRPGTSQFVLQAYQTRAPLAYGRTGAPVGSAFASWTPSFEPATLSVQYGTLGAGWAPYVVVELSSHTKYRHAFDLLETSIPQTAVIIDSEQSLSSGPVNAAVSAPRQARIGDADFRASLSGAGSTPTLSWSAPEVGVATWYEVQVWELSAAEGRTARTRGPKLVTAATSLRLPPGILVADRSYVLELRAVSTPGVDRRTELRRQSFPYAEASALSGIYIP